MPRPRALRVSARVSVFGALVATLLLARSSVAEQDPTLVLPPDAMSFFKELLPAPSLGPTADIAIEKDHAVYRFRRDGATADVLAFDASSCAAPTGRVCLQVGRAEGQGADALAREAIDGLEARARASWAASPWTRTGTAVGHSEVPAVVKHGDESNPNATAWLRFGRWFLASVLAASVVAVLRSWRTILRREALVPLGLFGLGATLRCLAHAAPADIRDVLGMLGATRRAGWASYLDLLFSWIPPTHAAVFWVHRFAGALGVPLLYLALRSRFTKLVAVSGAATLAVLPIIVRFDASDTPYAPLCTAFLGAIVAFDRFTSDGSRSALALGMGLLTVAMQLRPEGPWLVVPAALLCAHDLFVEGSLLRVQIRRPSTLAVIAGGLALNVPFALWAFVGHTSEGSHAPFYMRHFVVIGEIFGSPWFDFEVSPIAVSVLVVLGGMLAPRFGARGILWCVATLVALPLAELAVGQHAHVRYHLPSLHLACGLAGIGVAGIVDALPRPLRGSALAATTLAVLAALPRMGVLTQMWTPQLEFELFRRGLAKLPPKPMIVTFLDVQDGGFVPFSDPGTIALLDVARVPPTMTSFIYYRAASCVSIDAVKPEAGPLHELGGCDAFEARYRLTPIFEAELPALPFRGERYRADPIPVGFFRAELR